MLVESIEASGIHEIDDSFGGTIDKDGGVACKYLSSIGLSSENAREMNAVHWVARSMSVDGEGSPIVVPRGRRLATSHFVGYEGC